MPYNFDPNVCKNCPFGLCFEDRRENPIPGRKTSFRLRQQAAIPCTFQEFVPGLKDGDLTNLRFDEYLIQLRNNVKQAGDLLVGKDFSIDSNALRKVEGDVFELLIAAVLWNVSVDWNLYMESGQWESCLRCPLNAHPKANSKVAIVKLPRGYDTTRLFTTSARQAISVLENLLRNHDMILDLSSPDIVGIRLPETIPDSRMLFPITPDYRFFSLPINNFNEANLEKIESAYQRLEGKLSGKDLLFALAIKHTMRSDRLYQPLFEANVLKYLVQEVLGEKAFKFYVYAESVEGANVAGRYKAASLVSLIEKRTPQRAIDSLLVSNRPFELAQRILNDLADFVKLIHD